jgi:hypothetical protein
MQDVAGWYLKPHYPVGRETPTEGLVMPRDNRGEGLSGWCLTDPMMSNTNSRTDFRLKPLLRDFFRDLDVTSAPALTCVCDEQYISRGFGVRVYRITKSKKSEKRKNPVSKTVEIEEKGQK